MQNLAGSTKSTETFAAELRVIGAVPTPTDTPDGETKALVEGRIVLPNGFNLRIVRRWCYLSVICDPRLPESVVAELNELPFHGKAGPYSGPSGKLGSVARVSGYAGGMTADMILEEHGVGHWHCDTVEAACVLVKVLKEAIPRFRIDAVSAHRHYIQSYTEAWIAECAPMLDRTGLIPSLLRAALYKDQALDTSHPLIRELQATYPRQAV